MAMKNEKIKQRVTGKSGLSAGTADDCIGFLVGHFGIQRKNNVASAFFFYENAIPNWSIYSVFSDKFLVPANEHAIGWFSDKA